MNGMGSIFRRVCATLSLAFAILSCQTTPPEPAKTAQDDAILSSQKALVRTALDSGRADQALKTLREMLRERPEDASLHSLMGLTQLALKNPARAVHHFKKSYKADPEPASGLNLSSALIEAGDYDQAIQLLKSLLKAKGKDGKLYAYRERILHNLGYAYTRQKQFTTAQKWYKEALDENPTFFPSHLEVARIYEKTNRPALAAKSYRQAVDYCDVCFEPVKALTTIYVRMGRITDARKLLVQFSKVEGIATPDKVEAERLLKLVTTVGLGPNKTKVR